MTLWFSFIPVLVGLFWHHSGREAGVLLIATRLEWKSRCPTQPLLTLESVMNFSLALSSDSPDSIITRIPLAPCQLRVRNGTSLPQVGREVHNFYMVSTDGKGGRQAHHSLCSPLTILRSTFIERRVGKHFYNQWRWKSRFHHRHLVVWVEVGPQYCSVVFG